MSAGWLARRFRFDAPTTQYPEHHIPMLGLNRENGSLNQSIVKASQQLLGWQQEPGFWCGELEGDTILESEYIILLAFLGQEKSTRAIQAARYISQKQMASGGWSIYPGGPLEISASVKAYWALKLTGTPADSPELVLAKNAILTAGGAEKVNSFTRYYLALLGVISYQQCPAVPPELILLPNWFPINIYEMSAWSRTIVIPLSLLWAYRPSRKLSPDQKIDELFHHGPEKLPVTMPRAENLDPLKKQGWFNWSWFFRQLDRFMKLWESTRILPLRRRAIKKCTAWITERFEESDGLGAIFPPIIWSAIALKCLGHDESSPQLARCLNELEKLVIEENGTVRLQPCKSPVWDTAIASLALREANIPASSAGIQRAVQWLLSKEVRKPGDWSVRNPKVEPAGWFFEFENRFYPDVDDTIMVLMSLAESLPVRIPQQLQTEFIWRQSDKGEPTTLVAGQAASPFQALQELETIRPTLDAIHRGVRWVLAMQNKDGGWGAFDRDNNRELLTRVPFADHNAMIDPSSPDITARVLEMCGRLGIPQQHPCIAPALDYLWKTQEKDGSWIGRWGVNYIYGTWQVLVGLRAVGVQTGDIRVRLAAQWLTQAQQISGGWGETPMSYDRPEFKGKGTPTASQTAWAIMGLCAAGEAHAPAVARGVQFLLETQNPDGTWDEDEWTGTGFPRVFYLKYHYYRMYFPLMALSRVQRLWSPGT